jgi:RNA recognition motif-containing protein
MSSGDEASGETTGPKYRTWSGWDIYVPEKHLNWSEHVKLAPAPLNNNLFASSNVDGKYKSLGQLPVLSEPTAPMPVYSGRSENYGSHKFGRSLNSFNLAAPTPPLHKVTATWDSPDSDKSSENVQEKESLSRASLNFGLGPGPRRTGTPPGLANSAPGPGTSFAELKGYHDEVRRLFGCASSRQLLVFNISNKFSGPELSRIFEAYGQIRFVHLNMVHRGILIVGYYDARSAKQLCERLVPSTSFGSNISTSYCVQIPSSHSIPGNENVDGAIYFTVEGKIPSKNQLFRFFSQFGDVMSMQNVDSAQGSRQGRLVLLLEYYDARAAAGSLVNMRHWEHDGTRITARAVPMNQRDTERGELAYNFFIKSSHVGSMLSAWDKGVPRFQSGAHTKTSVSFSAQACHLNSLAAMGDPRMMGGSRLSSHNEALHSGTAKVRADGSEQYGGMHSFEREPNPQPRQASHKTEKRRHNFDISLHLISSGMDKRSTLMIRNIPNKYTQKMLMSDIDTNFRSMYDFFYLPIDFKNKCNMGYAFINFIDPIQILDFYAHYNNKKWDKCNSEKVCQIKYGRIQGKSALIARFQNSSLMHKEEFCRPLIFHSSGPMQGEPEFFPAPDA